MPGLRRTKRHGGVWKMKIQILGTGCPKCRKLAVDGIVLLSGHIRSAEQVKRLLAQATGR